MDTPKGIENGVETPAVKVDKWSNLEPLGKHGPAPGAQDELVEAPAFGIWRRAKEGWKRDEAPQLAKRICKRRTTYQKRHRYQIQKPAH